MGFPRFLPVFFCTVLFTSFLETRGNWVQLGSDIVGEPENNWGGPVSLSSDGTTVAIGAPVHDGNGMKPGLAAVYRFDTGSSTWIQMGSDILGSGDDWDLFGESVSLNSDGSTVAIGVPSARGGFGQVRVYNFDTGSSTWIQVGSNIDGKSQFDNSGYSVSLSSDGTTVAIGAPNNATSGDTGDGTVRIYSFDSGSSTWTQVGGDIDGESEFGSDLSGISVSLSSNGSTVAIGAPFYYNNNYSSGRVRIYRFETGTSTWSQVGSDIDGENVNDQSGSSVSLSSDGSTVAIGAPRNEDNGRDSGHVRIYSFDSGSSTWTQMGSDIDGESSYDYSGRSVSLSSDGSTVAIGAPFYDDGTNYESGVVRIYRFDTGSSTWTQVASDIVGENYAGKLGSSVSLSSDGSSVALRASEDYRAVPYDIDSSVRIFYLDTDGDGVGDVDDAFPLDSSESVDTDNDGTGDNADAFPLDSSETVDIDGDGIGDNADTDDDNDGVLDTADAFPLDSTESVDTDGDGTGNNTDTDDDGDGVLDADDQFPLDFSKSGDMDGDGIDNNADNDDDGDGVVDTADAFPLDSSESVDTDGDGTGNNADTDDDNDGIIDSLDAFPLSNDNNWVMLGSDIDGESPNDQSGFSVSLSSDGTTVAIGARLNGGNGFDSGHVRIFSFDSGSSTWTQMGSDIDGESPNDQSGFSVSLSSDGTTVAIGAMVNDGNGSNSGHVRIYSYDSESSTWTQMGSDIDGESEGDFFGHSVSLSSEGSTIAIGAVNNDGNGSNSGHVRIYSFDSVSSAWTQVGSDIDGESQLDYSGSSVSLSSDGTTVAIGAPSNDGNGDGSGHIRIYSFDSGSGLWTQVGSDIDGESADDSSGRSASLSSDGSTVAIGAYGNGSNSGHVRIYDYDALSSAWVQVGSDIDGESQGDYSGLSVSLSSDGNTVAIGARENDGNGSKSGHVRIYSFDSGSSTWTQMGSDIDGESAGDSSGYSPSLSFDGTTVAIGAPRNDGNGGRSGHVRIYSWDTDGDGVADTTDAFPLDYYESADTDGDGTGDNADAFPLDSSETVDTDSDGTGNNADTDDDNDGIIDTEDSRPLDKLNLGLEIQFAKDSNSLGKMYATWERVPGVSYELEGSADLSEWTILETYPPTTSLSVESYELRPENPHHFVRLKLYPPPNANASSEQIVIDSEGDGSKTDSPDGNVSD
jgi:hypothetical protein